MKTYTILAPQPSWKGSLLQIIQWAKNGVSNEKQRQRQEAARRWLKEHDIPLVVGTLEELQLVLRKVKEL